MYKMSKSRLCALH
uniref:Uncharacterized protein n=1 Tax=Anguilla anguilla TaxID=7936 RepID=A0A0E9QB47_ANGAN